MQFEWDRNKDEQNQQKHGISFDEAKALFTSDVDYLEIYDKEHSDDEDRFIAIGPIRTGIIVVIYTERADDIVRIISARSAAAKETNLYQKHCGDTDE